MTILEYVVVVPSLKIDTLSMCCALISAWGHPQPTTKVYPVYTQYNFRKKNRKPQVQMGPKRTDEIFLIFTMHQECINETRNARCCSTKNRQKGLPWSLGRMERSKCWSCCNSIPYYHSHGREYLPTLG